MILSDIEFFLADVPCEQPFADVRSVLVRLTTHRGDEGWGEAALPWRLTELAPRREALLPVLTGRSVFDIEELIALQALENRPLRSAIEMACWDLIGRIAGQPICRLLGGEYRHRVPVAVRLPDVEMQQMAVLAKELAGKGLHWLIQEARGDVDADVGRVRAILESTGGRVDLRFDGRERFDKDSAVELSDRLHEAGVSFILDPLPSGTPEFVAACRELASHHRTAPAMQRTISSERTAWEAVKAGSVSALSIDLQHVGGLLTVKKCATIAEASGTRATIAGPASLGISTAAKLQLAACSPAYSLGVESAHASLHDDVLTDGLQLSDGFFSVPLGPGLGVEVDIEKVERYSVMS